MNYLLQSWLSNFRVKISRWRRLERNCDISFTRLSHNKTKSLLAIWPTNFGKLSLVKRIVETRGKAFGVFEKS